MKKLFVPFLFDGQSSTTDKTGLTKLFSEETLVGYPTLADAVSAAKTMALTNPKGKVVIFESSRLIEPRKVEFSEKSYNEQGELVA